jgi:multidrug resistance efflux pump
MTTPVSLRTRILATGTLVLVAIVAVGYKYYDFMANPWTRNGQVMAQVVEVTPRVSGTIVQLPIKDNRFVKAGDVLFQIDPRTFQSELDYKRAELDETIDEIAALAAQIDASAAAVKRTEQEIAWYKQQVIGKKARLKDYRREFKRYTKMLASGASSQERVDQAEADATAAEARLEGAQAELRQGEANNLEAIAELAGAKADHGAYGDENARLRRAKAAVHHVELELEFTSVVAPVDGYVTNLNLRLGDHATANSEALALVDVSSYWVYGFFKESYLGDVRAGDLALVTLMSYPDEPIWGRVMGTGHGIYQKDGSTGQELLPKISATYEWIRQPQRVPLRVELGKLPEGVELIVGTYASVLVMTGTTGEPPPKGVEGVPSLPSALASSH